VTEAQSERAGWTPATRINGHVRPPASKSLAIRTLLAAALARGRTNLEGLSSADDVAAARRLVESLTGVRAVGASGARIDGSPPGFYAGWRAPEGVEVGESGTLARLATAALAFCGTPGERQVIRASGTLLTRESPALLRTLETAGVCVELLHDDPDRRGWPLAVTSIEPPEEVVLEHPTSSQEASGLALALAAWPGTRRLVLRGTLPSRPYYDLTLGVLAAFNARFGREFRGADEVLHIVGPLQAPEGAVILEADASAAAVALAGACLSGGAVTIGDLGGGSPQGDIRIVEHLRAFGCDAGATPNSLRASGAPTHGAELDLSGEPDLAPVLAAVGGVVALRTQDPAIGTTVLTGLETLDGKESPRLTVLAGALRQIGCDVTTTGDRLVIRPGQRTRGPLILDPRNDHRMAFAFALLGLEREGLEVMGPHCVSKSWPSFWTDLAPTTA
jgi:3-phosphoshikimate 1-carboxyvinyltransferase